MVRIIAGDFRSRRLAAPPDAGTTRPWTQRVKESVFNVLRGHCEGANVVDLFAGVGTIGLEAISRGAASVLMVEQDRKVFGLLEQNVRDLQCQDRADLLKGDALGPVALLRAPRPINLLFIDPPFAMMEDEGMRARVLRQIDQASSLLDPGGFVILRTPLDPHRVDHTVRTLAGPEIHDHGTHHQVCLYAHRQDAGDDTP